MQVYTELFLFSLIILIYWVITELFTVLFRFTGLPEERARFQVISLLTGCGFTTRESELLLYNRRRRALARRTMLFGYVFNITIVSSIINLVLSVKLSQAEHVYIGILIPLSAMAVIFVFVRVPKVRAWGSKIMERTADRMLNSAEDRNTVQLLHYVGKDAVAIVKLSTVPEKYRGIPVSQSDLKTEYGILVMLVEHVGKKPESTEADTVLEPGDKITVFGNYNMIKNAFHARERFIDLMDNDRTAED